MEDELAFIRHQGRGVQEFRRNIQQVWNDQAARDISTRFLNPHEADAKRMVDEMQSQHQSLKEASAKLKLAAQHAQKAGHLSEKAAEYLRQAQRDVKTAYQYHEQYRHHHSAARELLPQIEDAISAADSACQGVPTQ
jgi:Mg2+ and Co2+ transporter CorA